MSRRTLSTRTGGVEPILPPRRPTPALRLSNPLATLRGSRSCAGAAMVGASLAAAEAFARQGCPALVFAPHGCLLTSRSRARSSLSRARFAAAQRCPTSLAALFQFTQTNPLFVLAHPLINVAFEPGLFGCHLKPHEAPARACAYCSPKVWPQRCFPKHEASGNSAYLSSCCFAQALLSSDALGAVFCDSLEDVKPFEFGMAQIERSVVSGAGVRLAKLL